MEEKVSILKRMRVMIQKRMKSQFNMRHGRIRKKYKTKRKMIMMQKKSWRKSEDTTLHENYIKGQCGIKNCIIETL